jgi:hypothetical protein
MISLYISSIIQNQTGAFTWEEKEREQGLTSAWEEEREEGLVGERSEGEEGTGIG